MLMIGTGLRVAIVHARWNEKIVSPLVNGAIEQLQARRVKKENIVVQSVPGSWELPYAVSRLVTGMQVQGTSGTASDLLGADVSTPSVGAATTTSTAAFDAIIAIGVLIKGDTMHFEYIADAVCHGLMRVGIDIGIPVIFGILTVLNEAQALQRAGEDGGHNHALDWADAAVEMGQKKSAWQGGL